MSYKLDSFQIDAIESLYENLNVLVTAPTGAGKTIIAERGIEEYLDKGNRVIYTTPIKALSNQKYHDFLNSGFDTGLLTGDRNENPDAGLIIATTEILRNMIFTNDERINDIGLVEINEAFASVAMAWQKEMEYPINQINVNGGAIALGHPLGATGARLMTTMIHNMKRDNIKYGLQTMCEGGGQANVTILENCS